MTEKDEKNPGSDIDDITFLLSQLESEGEGGEAPWHDDQGSSSDPFDDFSDNDFATLQSTFETLESQMSKAADLGDFSMSGVDQLSGDDLDILLREAIEEGERSLWTPEVSERSFAEESDIYEENPPDLDLSVLYSGDEKIKFSIFRLRKWSKQQLKDADRPTKVLFASIFTLAGALVLAILFFAAVFVFDLFEDEHVPAVFAVEFPPYSFNNAGHSFVQLSTILGGDVITLSRVLLDERATVFYFSGILDTSRFVFTLEDNDGRVFNREIGFPQHTNRNEILEQTVVMFEPLSRTAQSFVLTITDLDSGHESALEIAYDGADIRLSRYLAAPAAIEANTPNIDFQIDYAAFSALGSTLHFSISHDRREDIVFAPSGENTPITIRHMGINVPAINLTPTAARFDEGLVVGRMDFGPLRSLMGRVDINFDHIYRRLHPRQTIPAAGLFVPGDDRAVNLDLGDYIITLRGIQRQGYFFVLPLHAHLRTFDEQTEVLTRVPVTLDIELVGTTTAGVTYTLPASRIIYDGRGTDALFDIRDNDVFAEIPRSRLYVRINSAYLRLEPFTFSLELDTTAFSPNEQREEISSRLEQALAAGTAGDHAESAVQIAAKRINDGRVYALTAERIADVAGDRLVERFTHRHVIGVIDEDGFVEIIYSSQH